MAENSTPAKPRLDLRCSYAECLLFELRLEPDEITLTSGDEPDCCAACGRRLEAYSGRSR
jgi:hypothetical protein